MNSSICSFKTVFNEIPNKKINIISTCLFKLKESYKNFNLYLYRSKNVKLLAQKLNFYILLFIDDTIYNDKNIYKKLISNIGSKKTIIIKYNCNKFKDDEGLHRGTFGTLIRFFPMFDFPGNKFGTVIVVDIDYVKPKLYKDDNYYYTMLKLLNDNKLDFIGRSHSNLLLDDKWISLKPAYTNKDNISFIANSLFSTKKFDHNLIVNYLNDLLNENSKLYLDVKEHTHKKYLDTVFKYGVDEYFLNHILYPYLKKNNFNFWCMYIYSVPYFVYMLNKNYEISNDKTFNKLYLLLLQYILNNKSNDINILYSNFQKIIETDNIPLTKEQSNIINNFYNFLEKLNNKKIYSLFDKKTLDFILKHKNYRECLDRYDKPNSIKKIYSYKYLKCK